MGCASTDGKESVAGLQFHTWRGWKSPELALNMLADIDTRKFSISYHSSTTIANLEVGVKYEIKKRSIKDNTTIIDLIHGVESYEAMTSSRCWSRSRGNWARLWKILKNREKLTNATRKHCNVAKKPGLQLRGGAHHDYQSDQHLQRLTRSREI